jgi:Asp-tRNA(Asn)/Glu-tRNA(Gln) amidotransferase A subunit family amidase
VNDDVATDLPAIARALSAGVTTSRAVVTSALRRYDEVEPVLRAFAWLDRERALVMADSADRRRSAGGDVGPLGGTPMGVKDIFDTQDLPTENGSALFRGRIPERTADVIHALEERGGIVLGKTVTSELAYYHPGPTTNPFDRLRTPGGSSMGSAAAVAAGIVPAAVGSQTNGSVIRPAAFCGVVGVKPTHDLLSTRGMMAFAPTLDTVGAFAQTVEGAALMCAAMARASVSEWWGGIPSTPPRLAAVRTQDWELASKAAVRELERALGELSSGVGPIEWLPIPAELDGSLPVHRTIMAYEGARTIGPVVARAPTVVSNLVRKLVAEGNAISEARYRDALAARDRLRAVFREWIDGYDALVTLPAPGEAPSSETTGDPRFCTRWTLLGIPIVGIPTGHGPAGLPLGMQLLGRSGADRDLLQVAAWVERELANRVARPAASMP